MEGRETIRIILHEDLGKINVCARFVLHTLSDEIVRLLLGPESSLRT